MINVEWLEAYEMGDEDIDNDHRELFRIIGADMDFKTYIQEAKFKY